MNKQGFLNAIAVLILNQPLGVGLPVRYDGDGSLANPGMMATVSGYGRFTNPPQPDEHSDFLRAADVPKGNEVKAERIVLN
jgi:hypothetical protein